MTFAELYSTVTPPDTWEEVLADYSDDSLAPELVEKYTTAMHDWEGGSGHTKEALKKLLDAAVPQGDAGLTDFLSSVASYDDDKVAVDKDNDGDLDSTFSDKDNDGAIEVKEKDGKLSSAEGKTLSDASMKNIARTLSAFRY